MFVGINLNIVSQKVMNVGKLTTRKPNASIPACCLPPFQLLNRALYRNIHHLKQFKQRREYLYALLTDNRVNDDFITTINQSSYRTIKTFKKFRGGR